MLRQHETIDHADLDSEAALRGRVRDNDELASLALLEVWETLTLQCECGQAECNRLIVVPLLEYVEARESGQRILAFEHRT